MDYSNEGFILPVIIDNIKGYASINTVLCREEDGLEVTGSYFVYLLHPVKGSMQFTIEPTSSQSMPLKKVERTVKVETEIVQQIIDAILKWKIKNVH